LGKREGKFKAGKRIVFPAAGSVKKKSAKG